MKRLRSYGEDLGSASGEKDIERPLSAAPLSSSSSHHRRWRLPDKGRIRPGVPDDARDREMSRGGVRMRIDHEFDGYDDREGSRGFRKRTAHDFGNGFEDREAWRSVRKRNDHDLDGFDDREGGRAMRKGIDHDLPESFDDREGLRGARKRLEPDTDGFDRRKGFDRYRDRDGVHRGGHVSPLVSPKGGYVSGERDRERDRYRDRERDRIHRSESFCVSRGDFFPKGFRSERDWLKREGSVPSWRKFGSRSKRDVDDRAVNSSKNGGIVDGGSSSKESFRSPHGSKDVKSPTWSKDSKDSVEHLKDVKKSEGTMVEGAKSGSGCEIEEGELQPDSLKESHASCVSVKEVKNVAESEDQTQVESNIKKKQSESELNTNVNESDINEKEQLTQLETAEAEISAEQGKLHMIESTCQSEEIKHDVAVNNGDRPAFSESLRDDHPDCPVPANDELDSHAKVEVNATRVPFQVSEAKVQDAQNSEGCYISESRPSVSEGLRDHHPESSVPANGGLDCQPEVEANDIMVTCPVVDEKVGDALNPEVVPDEVIMPLVSRDVAIVPQVTKDEDIMPQVTRVADTIPQVTDDVDSAPQVVKDDDIMPQVTKDAVEIHHHEERLSLQVGKDKGKAVAICLSDEIGFPGKGSLMEQNLIDFGDVSSAGPSTRGFELFSCTAGVKADRATKPSLTNAQNEKMNLEPLELSLALPNVSVLAPSHSAGPPLNSPPRARSIQSRATTLLTGSDGFTASMSFSGSQFMHNPSCSLTHNSIDYDCEQSVKSRPLFQGVDWQALSMNDSLPKELLKYQRSSSNIDGSLRLSNSSLGNCSSQPLRGSSTVVDRLGGLQRQLSEIKMRNQDDIGSSSPAGSQGTMLDRVKGSRPTSGEGSGSKLFRSSSDSHMKPVASATKGSNFINGIMGLLVSEPAQTMAQKFSEMTDESIRCLKDAIQELVLKEDHRQQLYSLRGLLNTRSDLNLETLLKCQRAQLEILVAIKTGVAFYLWRGQSISSADLAEIFLNLKCMNPNCGCPLPVDDCECKFCSKKSGFCSMCMCLVCSKFDTASNTCGWVGCDFCSHWCHTDCGLQSSYIRNGQSASSTQGTSEMQFYCMACDHPSEMFGFVTDVFKSCAAEWEAESMLKELECVKRIFTASNDPRGKLLYGIASQLLARLKSGSNIQEIRNQIMGFFKNCDSKLGTASASSGRDLQALAQNKGTNRSCEMATSTETPIWFKTAPFKDSTRPENNIGPIIPNTEGSSAGDTRRSIWDSTEMQKMMTMSSNGTRKPSPTTAPTPVTDELESLVKIKHAESKMFQSRADDARREAERLTRIAINKSEKIDEEYSAKVAKLRLGQVEETRRQKMEELQRLERSHQEYVNMKTRMQEDIKELLLRMEDAKKNVVNGG